MKVSAASAHVGTHAPRGKTNMSWTYLHFSATVTRVARAERITAPLKSYIRRKVRRVQWLLIASYHSSHLWMCKSFVRALVSSHHQGRLIKKILFSRTTSADGHSLVKNRNLQKKLSTVSLSKEVNSFWSAILTASFSSQGNFADHLPCSKKL